MASIIKSGARKPLVVDGAICSKLATHWVPSEDTPGHLTGTVGITVTVHDPASRKDYRIDVSRGEALYLISELSMALLATEPKEVARA